MQHNMVRAAFLVTPGGLSLYGKEFCLVLKGEAFEEHLLLTSLL